VANSPKRSQRVAMLAEVIGLPDLADQAHNGALRASLARPGEERALIEDFRRLSREFLNVATRVGDELRDLYNSAEPKEQDRPFFDEVFPALNREANKCSRGFIKMLRFLEVGLEVPIEGGETMTIRGWEAVKAVDIYEAKHILRMASEELLNRFPIDETAAARAMAAGGPANFNLGDTTYMGHYFANITNSTIVNDAVVIDAFKRLEAAHDPEVAQALLRVADAVAASGSRVAGEVFDRFAEAVLEPNRDRSKLRELWDGLVAVIPDAAVVTEAASTIAKLFL
jgi:hypothetical protein